MSIQQRIDQTDHDGTRHARARGRRRFIPPPTPSTVGSAYHQMAEEISTDFGQTYSSYVPAVGRDGRVDNVVHVEDCFLPRSEQFLHRFSPTSGVLTPSFGSGISVSPRRFFAFRPHTKRWTRLCCLGTVCCMFTPLFLVHRGC